MRTFALALALAAAMPAAAQAPVAPPVATPPAGPAPAAPPPAAAAPPAPTRVLTLEEAVRLARERLPALRQARASADASQARADQARAGLLPQVTGTASFARARSVGATTGVSAPSGGGTLGGGGSVASPQVASTWRATLNASQLVWDFGQTSNRWGAARQTAEADVEGARSSEQQAVLAVRTAFFQARAQHDLVRVASATVENQQAHLQQIDAFVRMGTRPPIDLAQARTNVANAQVQLVNAENGYDTARARLNQAMGVEGPIDYDVASEGLPPVEGEDGTIDALLAEALRNRPDVAAAARRINAAERSVSAAQGAYGPSVSVVADYGRFARPSLDDPDQFLPAVDSPTWSIGATLTWPIFTGGLTRAQVEEARANVAASQAVDDQVRQQVRVDVEQARLSVRATRTALVAAGEAVTNAREQLRLAEGRYRAGAGSALELSDAQVAQTNAEAQQVQAEYNLSIARAQLLQALGRI